MSLASLQHSSRVRRRDSPEASRYLPIERMSHLRMTRSVQVAVREAAQQRVSALGGRCTALEAQVHPYDRATFKIYCTWERLG
jgi:hypothetical protein